MFPRSWICRPFVACGFLSRIITTFNGRVKLLPFLDCPRFLFGFIFCKAFYALIIFVGLVEIVFKRTISKNPTE